MSGRMRRVLAKAIGWQFSRYRGSPFPLLALALLWPVRTPSDPSALSPPAFFMSIFVLLQLMDWRALIS